MAIHIYTGSVGSGKTYHMVNSVIIPFLLDPQTKARRLYHNIRLNPHVIEGEHLFPSALCSRVFPVTNEEMLSLILDMEKIAGSLIVIDEFQLIWPSSKGMTNPKHLEFFTTHRHHMIDICIGTQDIENIVKNVRNLVEVENHFRALKDIGFSSGYVVDRYYNRSKKRGSRFNAKYDPAKFKFYNSHAISATAAGLSETPMVRPTRYYRFIIFLVFAGVFFGGYMIWSLFARYESRATLAKQNASVSPSSLPVASSLPTSIKPHKSDHPPVVGVSYSGQPLIVDKSFRVTSLIRIGIKRVYTLSDLSPVPEGTPGRNFRMVRYDDSWNVGDLVQVGDVVPAYNPSPAFPVDKEPVKENPKTSVPVSVQKNYASSVASAPYYEEPVPAEPSPASAPYPVPDNSISLQGDILPVPGNNLGLEKSLRFGTNSVAVQNAVVTPGFHNLQNK